MTITHVYIYIYIYIYTHMYTNNRHCIIFYPIIFVRACIAQDATPLQSLSKSLSHGLTHHRPKRAPTPQCWGAGAHMVPTDAACEWLCCRSQFFSISSACMASPLYSSWLLSVHICFIITYIYIYIYIYMNTLYIYLYGYIR